MRAYWGDTPMPVNGAEVTSQMTVVESTQWGRPLRYQVAYSVTVVLDGSGQADLSAKELAFRAALMRPDQNFVLKTDAGKNSSAAILVRDTANGTRVVQISAPQAQGAEFVTRRTITFTVVGEYHVRDAQNAVVSWRETLTIQGTGGPRRVWRFPINAPAIRQTVTPFSLVVATQQGEAVGYLKRPPKPLPLFPAYLVHDAVGLTLAAPTYIGGSTYVDFPVGWSYRFERGDGPLIGAPSLPPGVI